MEMKKRVKEMRRAVIGGNEDQSMARGLRVERLVKIDVVTTAMRRTRRRRNMFCLIFVWVKKLGLRRLS
jgi:hypothetical protein